MYQCFLCTKQWYPQGNVLIKKENDLNYLYLIFYDDKISIILSKCQKYTVNNKLVKSKKIIKQNHKKTNKMYNNQINK